MDEKTRRQSLSIEKINQDCACVVHPIPRAPGAALFCVLDGHGAQGEAVSLEALHSLCHSILTPTEPLGGPAATMEVLENAFEQTQLHIRAQLAAEDLVVDARESGACALVALLNGRELTIGSVGDCRAVLGTRKDGKLVAERLSLDHCVDHPEERERIEAAGGWVRTVDEAGIDVEARCYKDKEKPWMGPGLRISRSLGDVVAEQDGMITALPTCCSREITDEDEVLILGSDGVWEFIDDEAAVKLVQTAATAGDRPGFDANGACCTLMAASAMKWRKHEGIYRDDITAMVIYLPALIKKLQETAQAA